MPSNYFQPGGGGGGSVISVFGRTGAVVAANGDYTATNVGLGSVTNDAQTKAAIVPNTAPSAGQILAGNAGGTAYAPVSMSGGATIASTGAVTLSITGTANQVISTVVSGAITLSLPQSIGTSNNVQFGTITGTSFLVGTLGFSDTGILLSAQSSTNSYNQIIIQNSTAGATASADVVVTNNSGTATTFYGDFGMNSSTFTGTGSLNLASAVYLSATSGDLVLGTTTSNGIHMVVNGGATDSLAISSAGAVSLPGLSTNGLVKTSGGTGALSVATAGTDYLAPSGMPAADLVTYFGDGNAANGGDGDATISGALTLTRHMYYRNLTISAGAAVNASNFFIFVSGNLDISSAPSGWIYDGGGNGGAGAANGTGGSAGSTTSGGGWGNGQSGFNGQAGTTTTGTAGASSGYNNGCIGGCSGASGAGGSGSSGAGGASGAAAVPGNVLVPRRFPTGVTTFLWVYNGSLTLQYPSGQSGAGGGGGGDGTNKGGGGGAGATGGGGILVAAQNIICGSNSNTGLFRAKGGTGGAGGTPVTGNCGGGGGGCGGGGGHVVIAYLNKTGSIANAIDVSGGAGGAGGNGVGTGNGGAGGGNGMSGRVQIFNLATGTCSETVPTASTNGSAASGATGGAGASANTLQVTL